MQYACSKQTLYSKHSTLHVCTQNRKRIQKISTTSNVHIATNERLMIAFTCTTSLDFDIDREKYQNVCEDALYPEFETGGVYSYV